MLHCTKIRLQVAERDRRTVRAALRTAEGRGALPDARLVLARPSHPQHPERTTALHAPPRRRTGCPARVAAAADHRLDRGPEWAVPPALRGSCLYSVQKGLDSGRIFRVAAHGEPKRPPPDWQNPTGPGARQPQTTTRRALVTKFPFRDKLRRCQDTVESKQPCLRERLLARICAACLLIGAAMKGGQ
jgi:hypothetical protein